MTVTVSPRTMDSFTGNANSFAVPSNAYLAAVQTDDGDTSYVAPHDPAGFVAYSTQFTGLPVGAGIIAFTLTTRVRGFQSGTMIVNVSRPFLGEWNGVVSGGSSWGTNSFSPTILSPSPITNSTVGFNVRYNWSSGSPAITYIALGFTYSLPPNAPTITSPVGVTNSLSPTLAVSTSNPANGDTITHTEFEVRRVSDNAVMWQSGWKSGTSVAYGGTSLVSDVEYRIRARNRNTHGVEGAWSGYTTFTPNTNVAPTAVAVSPSGNIGTLTPTMRLQFNDVSTDSFERYQIQARVSGGSTIWDTGWQDTNSAQKSAREVNIPYGGSALSNTVTYQWRGRVEDGYGVPSNYTNWVSFTPTLQPNAPTVVEPLGKQDTLTPFISGEYSQGAGNIEAGWQYRIRQSGNVIYSSGDILGDGNLLANGTFESTSTPWAGRSGNETIARSTTRAHSGTYSLGITASATDDGTYSPFTGAAETFYVAGAWVWVPSGKSVRIYLYDDVSGFQGGQTAVGNDDWQYIYVAATTGSGSTTHRVYLRYESTGEETYYIDDVRVGNSIELGQAYGTPNPNGNPETPPSLAWGTNYEISLRSKDVDGAYSEWSAWASFHTNAAPTTPTNLSPSGSIINATTPLLSWTHNDPDGDAQTAAQVELREVDGDAAVTGYDPKTLEQEGSTHTVTETLTATPATDYRWRVRTRGLEGAGYGPWSDWSTFTVATVPAFTITAPSPSEEVGHPALTVEWTFSGGSGTQQDYRVIVYAADQTTVVYDSDVLSGTADSFQIPSGYLKNGNSYYVQVSGRDTNSEASQSDKVFITTSWTLPATLTLTVTPIGSQD